MPLKTIAIGLNILLLILCLGFFIGHGLPKSLMLWSSAILWFFAPMVNLLYIRKIHKTVLTNIAVSFDLWLCQILVKLTPVIRQASEYIF